MDNPSHLLLWDCLACTEDSEQKEVIPNDQWRANSSSTTSLSKLPPGVCRINGSNFSYDPTMSHPSTPIRSANVSGATTPLLQDSKWVTEGYYYSGSTSLDRGRYDHPVILKEQKSSVYDNLEPLAPLSPGILLSPLPATQTPSTSLKTPVPAQSRTKSLYKEAAPTTSTKLMEATQTIVQDAWNTLSPYKRKPSSINGAESLMKAKPVEKSSFSAFSWISSFFTSSTTQKHQSSSLNNTEDEYSSSHAQHSKDQFLTPSSIDRRFEVTSGFHQLTQQPPSGNTPNTHDRIDTQYGRQNNYNNYTLQMPSTAVPDFPTPSRTPYHPQYR